MKKLLRCAVLAALCVAQQGLSQDENWTVQRTEYGHPNLQGFWTNTTQTPIERPVALGTQRVYSAEEVAALEQAARDFEQQKAAPLDADRAPPPLGGASSATPARLARAAPRLWAPCGGATGSM